MTITAYGKGAYRLATSNQFVGARNDLADLQRQLATQKKSETYGGLGIDRAKSLDLNAKIASLDSWLSGIEGASVNLNLQAKSVESISTLAAKIRTDISTSTYLPSEGGRTGPQILAGDSFAQAIDLLNIDINGRYVFSGRATDVKTTESTQTILNGDGIKAGLKQLIAERATADGIAANGTGRLTSSAAGTTATIARQAGINAEYGFAISRQSAGSTNLQLSYTPAAPAQATSLSVNVAAQPLLGEQVRVKLDLPDGTQTEVVLTAKNQSTSSDDGFVIGATAADTATNIAAALDKALKRETQTTLKAASAIWTSEDFFNASTNFAPRRVPADLNDAPTRAGAGANTVIWYRGEDGLDPAVTLDPLADKPQTVGPPPVAVPPNPSARATAAVQVDRGQMVQTGTRANEGAIRTALAQIAAFSLVEFPQNATTAQAGYNALAERTRDGLGYGDGQKPFEISTELGVAQNSLKAAMERHEATKAYFQTNLGKVEEIDKSQVATEILALRTSLEASYQVTSILSNLSLTKYL